MSKQLEAEVINIVETCIQNNSPIENNIGVFISYDMEITLEDINDISVRGVFYPINQFIVEDNTELKNGRLINVDLIEIIVQDFLHSKIQQ